MNTLNVKAILQPDNHRVAVQCIKSCTYRSRTSVNVHIEHVISKVISLTLTMRWLLVAGSQVPEFQKLLVSWDFHSVQSIEENCMEEKKKNTCSECQVSGSKCVVDERGPWRMACLVWSDRTVTVTTHYIYGIQKGISESLCAGIQVFLLKRSASVYSLTFLTTKEMHRFLFFLSSVMFLHWTIYKCLIIKT